MKGRRRLGRAGVFAFAAVMAIGATDARAGSVVVSGSGANAAAIQAKVDQFRTALGALNSNVPGSFMVGRREISWEGLRSSEQAPNLLAADYYNDVSPRGVEFSGAAGITFQVSAGTGTTEFGNINPTYPAEFSTFSSASLFTPIGTNVMDVTFFVPGTGIAASVNGFGAVFTDVDRALTTSIEYFDDNGDSLGVFFSLVQDNGVSFLGVSFTAGERVRKVRITCGNKSVAAGNNDVDGGATASDVVVMDDFIYAEPIPYPDAWAIVNDGTNDLIRFNSRTPAALDVRVPTANLANTNLAAIDFRPSNGKLYALGIVGATGRLLESFPGHSYGLPGPEFTIAGSDLGMDFNPVTDRIRLVSNGELNILVNPDNAAVTLDSSLNPGNPSVVAAAYTNNIPNATGATTIFGIDSGANTLVTIGSNNGLITAIGPITSGGVTVDTTAAAGLDCQGYTDTAYATLTVGAVSALYRIDTDTAEAHKIGATIGSSLSVKGLALEPQAPTNFTAPAPADLVGVDTLNHLLKFNSDSPGTVATLNISGLQPNEQAVEIAYRASDNSFFLLGITEGPAANDTVARLYKVNINTGAVTLFGSGPINTVLADNVNYALDINPISGRIEVYNSADQNVSVNNSGTQASLSTIDHPFQAEQISGASYDRVDTDPTTTTTQFALDFSTDSLVMIGAEDQGFRPNANVVSTIGKTGVVTGNQNIGFGIARGTNAAFAAMHVDGLCRLYNINLKTGYAFRRGTIGNGASDVRGLAVVPPPLQGALANISTRLKVETGDNVLIGGFILTGGADKKVIVRAIGPSTNLPGALLDPTLELYDGNGNLLRLNDNWMDAFNKQDIIDSTIPPSDPAESAIVITLPANGKSYTAIVRGANNTTGIGLVEAYDLDLNADSRLANISTRGFVQTGNDVLIAGTIVLGQSSQKVIIRAIGPSLPIVGKLENPSLELRDSNGNLVAQNDNWKSDQMAEIIATTIPPTNDLESAIVTTLTANTSSYTAIVRGVNGGTGIGIVEVYALQ